jgi:homoserine kinase
MTLRSVQVRVPATVGNFAGVASSTAALDGCLNVKATLRYFGENGERVPRDRSNLVVRAMESGLGTKGLEFPGADFEIYSSVPVGVGLGSSAAAVLAGLIAADRLFHLGLSEKALLELAALNESRLDNVRAAWFGGLVSPTDAAAVPPAVFGEFAEGFGLDVVIPAFDRLDTPFASTHDKEVPGLGEALNTQLPGVSVFLCGSGPAVGIVDRELRSEAVRAVQNCFTRHGIESRSIGFHLSRSGARDWNAPRSEVAVPPPDRQEPVRKPTLIPV